MQGVLLIIWLIIVPIGMGLLPMRMIQPEKRKYGMTILCGYLFMFASFEIITVPILLQMFSRGFRYVRVIYGIFAVVTALAGYVVTWCKRKDKPLYSERLCLPGSRLCWCGALILLGFTLLMALTHANFDGDDAYYVVQSQITEETDTMYTQQPYTGGSTGIDMRHALALFTMWIAFIGRMSGVHSTILCHLILPLVLIPLTYLIVTMIGRELLDDQDKQEMLPWFCVMIQVLYLFGNVSIYTTETFMLTRTWQGKSVACNILLPSVLFFLLLLYKDYQGKRDWGIFVILSGLTIVAGSLSSLAVVLAAMMIGLVSLYMSVKMRSVATLAAACAACIPAVLYILLYQFVWYLVEF